MDVDEEAVKQWQDLIPKLRAVLPVAKESSKRCASRQFWAVAEACKRENCRVSELLRPWRNLTYAMLRKSRKEYDRQEMRLAMSASSSESGSEYSDDDRDVDLDRMNPYISDADAFLRKMFEEEKERLGNAKATLDQCRQSIIERTREDHERQIRENPNLQKKRDESEDDETIVSKQPRLSSPLRGAIRKRQASVISVESTNTERGRHRTRKVKRRRSASSYSYNNRAKDRVCERCDGPVSNKSRQYCRECLLATQREAKAIRDAEKAKAAAAASMAVVPVTTTAKKMPSRSPSDSFTDSGNSTAATPDLQEVVVISTPVVRPPTVTRSGRTVKLSQSAVAVQASTPVHTMIQRFDVALHAEEYALKVRKAYAEAPPTEEELPARVYPPTGAHIVCDECATNAIHYVQGMCKRCYDSYRNEVVIGRRVKKESDDVEIYVPPSPEVDQSQSMDSSVLDSSTAAKRSNRCRGPQCAAFLSRNAKTGLCRNCYLEYPEYRDPNSPASLKLMAPVLAPNGSQTRGREKPLSITNSASSQNAANTSNVDFIRGQCVICRSKHNRPRAPTCSLKCHRMMKIRESQGLPIGQVTIKREVIESTSFDEPVESSQRSCRSVRPQKGSTPSLPHRPKLEPIYIEIAELPTDFPPPEMSAKDREKFEQMCEIRSEGAMCRMCFAFLNLNQRNLCTKCTEQAVTSAQRLQANSLRNKPFLEAFREATDQYMYHLKKKPE